MEDLIKKLKKRIKSFTMNIINSLHYTDGFDGDLPRIKHADSNIINRSQEYLESYLNGANLDNVENLDQAISILKDLKDFDTDPRALSTFATCMLYQGKPEESVKYYQQSLIRWALILSIECANYANALTKMEHYEESLELLKNSEQLFPLNPWAWANRFCVLSLMKADGRIQEEFQRINEVWPEWKHNKIIKALLDENKNSEVRYIKERHSYVLNALKTRTVH